MQKPKRFSSYLPFEYQISGNHVKETYLHQTPGLLIVPALVPSDTVRAIYTTYSQINNDYSSHHNRCQRKKFLIDHAKYHIMSSIFDHRDVGFAPFVRYSTNIQTASLQRPEESWLKILYFPQKSDKGNTCSESIDLWDTFIKILFKDL